MTGKGQVRVSRLELLDPYAEGKVLTVILGPPQALDSSLANLPPQSIQQVKRPASS